MKLKISSGTLKKVLLHLPYFALFTVFDRLAYIYRTGGKNLALRLASVLLRFDTLFRFSFFSYYLSDILTGLVGALIVYLFMRYSGLRGKKFRKDKEYGSARWGTPADIAKYMDDAPDENIILTQTESLTMSDRPKKPKYARNKNVLVIGGSGSGKTRFFIKPNIMQMHSTYVITDPKGTILIECGKLLRRGTPKTAPKLGSDNKPIKDAKGNIVTEIARDKTGKIIYEPYEIKVLNTINFSKSMHYNPFEYIRSEKDILKLVNFFMVNTTGDSKGGDDFWAKAEALLYQALIGYIYYEAPKEEQNFNTLVEMVNASETREDDENFQNTVDIMMEELERKDPEHFAVRQYKKYKLAAGKTAKSILISCGARLAPFDIKEVRDLMAYDELELDKLGDRKTAMFVIIPDTDDTFNFIVAIMYSQLFNLLCDVADDKYGGRLPVPVRCLLDEFANIGKIPKFEKLIATIRSRRISASIVLQTKSQLKDLYKDNAETIAGNCDCTLFLGGGEKTTLKDLSETFGKETIDIENTGTSRGSQASFSTNAQRLGRELMTIDELATMDGGKCVLQLRGERPFYSDKFDITEHQRYKYLSDADPKNAFDVQKYMKNRKVIKGKLELNPNDSYEIIEYEEENETLE